MRSIPGLAVLAASAVRGAHQGFNYGAFFTDNSPKMQADFEAEFRAAQNLPGAPGNGFNSARLYTMIQWGTARDPISAIPAAIATNTTLLLGVWCSAGSAVVDDELAALRAAVATYGARFADLVVGISVGSEDLYRASATGRQNGAGRGAGAAELAGYVARVRAAVASVGPLAGVPVGHVDTWTEWVELRNAAVARAVDFVGVDAYSYWQVCAGNGPGESGALFGEAVARTRAAVVREDGTMPRLWITETGFPVSGHTSRDAVPSAENAARFWRAVGCPLFGKVDVWWFLLRDAARGTPEPSFGIVGAELEQGPLFDLSCEGVEEGEACDAG